MSYLFDYLYIIVTIGFIAYGQLIIKWRIVHFGELPIAFFEKVKFLIALLFDPMIFSGFVAVFVAALAWMAAMTKFDLSHVSSFMSLNFVVVLLLSAWCLNEPMTFHKVLGVSLIVGGVMVVARG